LTVYFTDRDLGLGFPGILSAAGLAVERHRDHFAADCADETWLETVGNRGWVALTHDQNIRYRPNEKAAVVRHGVRLLVIVGDAPYAQLAESFVATLPRIERFLARHSAPFIAKVYRPSPRDAAGRRKPVGRIELWFTP